ncbi:hypothetical protein PFICI_13896 [Pestalotiopsis fici W106-1]|uniref:Heterokaryon incompatibility domain-containing protein n=1 Tax=Pestalotiopsis fici (strain W106-1 / CGMCC3.15140) TaxID=1229662 RepID=W3WJB9_PESFW|nr:uncharacterized protein PFICI_13896 [Pestalotiopsis fici W106-1]ETS74030.1 hypothetical protein PFICI_13896 [Pestalotiopsis fici W106-1]
MASEKVPTSTGQVPRHPYSPLQKGHIRLLRLMPHSDQDAAIRCELFDHRFDDINPRKGTHLYEALSYVWGSGDKPMMIFTESNCLPVGRNLYEALKRLRDCTLPRIIWIDAICINQNDNKEREQQVGCMAEIYARASRVIIWLEETEVERFQGSRQVMTNGDHAFKIIDSAARDDQLTELSHVDREAVLALLRRSWFERIWVLQEVAAARHVVIMSLGMEMDGYAFYLGWSKLKLALGELNLQSRVSSAADLMKDAVLRPKCATSRSDRVSLDIHPLGTLMDLYHDRKATDRLDKVYALLGMSSDAPTYITPKYDARWGDIFRQLIRSSIGEQASVKTWDQNQLAIIQSKGCVLGEVATTDYFQGNGQRLGIR